MTAAEDGAEARTVDAADVAEADGEPATELGANAVPAMRLLTMETVGDESENENVSLRVKRK